MSNPYPRRDGTGVPETDGHESRAVDSQARSGFQSHSAVAADLWAQLVERLEAKRVPGLNPVDAGSSPSSRAAFGGADQVAENAGPLNASPLSGDVADQTLEARLGIELGRLRSWRGGRGSALTSRDGDHSEEQPSDLEPGQDPGSDPLRSRAIGTSQQSAVADSQVVQRPGVPVAAEPSVAAPEGRAGLARRELERLRLESVREAREVLLERSWEAALQADAWRFQSAWVSSATERGDRAFAGPASEHRAWSTLDAQRREGLPMPGPPQVGEAPAAILRRLLEHPFGSASGVGGAAEDRPLKVSPIERLWRARATSLEGGPGAGLEQLANLDSGEPSPEELRQRVQWWLELGRPGRALHELEHSGDALHSAADLVLWVGVLLGCLGEAERAREWVGGALQSSRAFPFDGERARCWRSHCPWAAELWPIAGRAAGLAGSDRSIFGAAGVSPVVSSRSAAGRTSSYVASNYRSVDRPAALECAPPIAPGDLESLRQHWGACLVGIQAWSDLGGWAWLDAACSMGLLGRFERWRQERDFEGHASGSAEAVVLANAAALRDHAEPGSSAIHSATGARALVLHPIRDSRGEVLALLRVECEHHLLPTPLELDAIAAPWALLWSAEGKARFQTGLTGGLGLSEVDNEAIPANGSPNRRAEHSALSPESQRALAQTDAWIDAAVHSLPLKWGRRSWAWLSLSEGAWSVAREGGPEQAGPRHRSGSTIELSRAVERVVRSGQALAWRADLDHLGLWPKGRSGLMLPIREGREVVALFAVESERVDDLGAEDLARLVQPVAALWPGWCLARFAADRVRAGLLAVDPWYLLDVDPEPQQPAVLGQSNVAARIAEWDAIAVRNLGQPSGSQAKGMLPVLCLGEPGVGAGVVAEWFAWRRGGSEALATARGGRRLVVGRQSLVELGSPSGSELSRALATHLAEARLRDPDQEGGALPWIRVQLPGSPAVRSAEARVQPEGELQAWIAAADRHWPGPWVYLRPLRERRAQFDGLLRALLADLGESCDVPFTRLSQVDVLGLWRQPWSANAAGLRSTVELGLRLFAARVRCLGPSDPLVASPLTSQQAGADSPNRCPGAADWLAATERLGLEWLDRLPARHPRREWLIAAIDSTRLANGRENLRAAAERLGWDRQTLTRRWRELQRKDPGVGGGGAGG